MAKTLPDLAFDEFAGVPLTEEEKVQWRANRQRVRKHMADNPEDAAYFRKLPGFNARAIEARYKEKEAKYRKARRV